MFTEYTQCAIHYPKCLKIIISCHVHLGSNASPLTPVSQEKGQLSAIHLVRVSGRDDCAVRVPRAPSHLLSPVAKRSFLFPSCKPFSLCAICLHEDVGSVLTQNNSVLMKISTFFLKLQRKNRAFSRMRKWVGSSGSTSVGWVEPIRISHICWIFQSLFSLSAHSELVGRRQSIRPFCTQTNWPSECVSQNLGKGSDM